MGDDAVAKLSRTLGHYQALVVGGLAFLVLFAVTMMGVMLFLSFRVGAQAEKLEGVALETHNVLCALYAKEVRANVDAAPFRKTGLLDERGNVVIEASLIQRGIDQRKETITAMDAAGLTC